MGVACRNVVRAQRRHCVGQTFGRDPWLSRAAALQPEDHVGGLGFEHEFESARRRGGAGLEPGSFVDVARAARSRLRAA